MRTRKTALAGVAALLAIAIGGGIGAAVFLSSSSSSAGDPREASAASSAVDPGMPLSRSAPDFTLTDQFGRHVSLRSFRGKVVILAFNDPVCTTVCPLTTTAMIKAKQMLGQAASRVQLLGVAANPQATAVRWVKAYSRVHEMTNRWYFLTAPLRSLRRVWREYRIEAALAHGLIDHTPAIYLIDQRGRLRRLFMTQMAYADVDQQGRMLAQATSSLLPDHPAVHSSGSDSQVLPLTPGQRVELPRARGGAVRLGPGSGARLYVFFASWLSEIGGLRTELASLNRYEALAKARGLPKLTAVDEGSVEPSAQALPQLIQRLPHPPSYPVAVDASGRVGDGYRVQDLPWFTLVSASGRVLWYYDASTLGWPTADGLMAHVRAALAHTP